MRKQRCKLVHAERREDINQEKDVRGLLKRYTSNLKDKRQVPCYTVCMP